MLLLPHLWRWFGLAFAFNEEPFQMWLKMKSEYFFWLM
jgi:hypothetical protein